MGVFDGLSEIFADTFGELVVYTRKATGVPATITAIWTEAPLAVVQGEADSDAIVIDLHVMAATVVPAEGDTAQRVKDGKTCRVVTPIRPDGQGMIVAGLEVVTP